MLTKLSNYIKSDLIEADFLKVDKNGLIDLEDLKNNIKENTLLISVMYVNNEIGTVEPIQKIGELVKNLNRERKNRIIFHTDAVQAVNYFDCDVKKLGADLLSFSDVSLLFSKARAIFKTSR